MQMNNHVTGYRRKKIRTIIPDGRFHCSRSTLNCGKLKKTMVPTLTLLQQCVTRTLTINCTLFVRTINKVYVPLTFNNVSIVSCIVKFLPLNTFEV